MKKEYLILTALIVILCTYLFLHDENRDYTTLPEIPEIDTSQVTGIVIEKNKTRIEFSREKNLWTLTREKFPADKFMVDNMLSVIKNLRLTSLVSQKENPGRYSLDPENRIRVFLKQKNETIFEMDMGKTAPTFNHTFVMLKNHAGVYHAGGSFRSHFDHETDDYRNKKVLAFKTPDIKSLTIQKGDITKSFKNIPWDESQEKSDTKEENAPETVWRETDGSDTDQKTLTSFLSALSNLQCKGFQHSGTADGDKLSIVLKNGKTHRLDLKIIRKNEDNILTGISSLNKYEFILSQIDSSRILENVDKLLGIYTQEKTQEE